MKRVILVGIDGSEPSSHALDWAINEAIARSWTIRLAGAYSLPITSDPRMAADFRTTTEHSVLGFLKEALERANHRGVDAEAQVTAGDASTILVEQSAAAGMAVVGNKGHGGFAGRLLGSVAARLAAHSSCPTVVVSKAPRSRFADSVESNHQAQAVSTGLTEALVAGSSAAREPRHDDGTKRPADFRGQTVLGIDILDQENPAIWEAADLSMAHGRPLSLIVVGNPAAGAPRWMLEEMDTDRYFNESITGIKSVAAAVRHRYPGLAVRWQIFDGKPAKILIDVTSTADLVVLGTRGYGGFPGLLMGSVSQAVLQYGSCPVMIVPTTVTAISSATAKPFNSADHYRSAGHRLKD